MSTAHARQYVLDSSCYAVNDGALTALRPLASTVSPLAALTHSQFRAMMLSGVYPCLGGVSAVRTGHYRLGLYPSLGSPASIQDCAADLHAFLGDHPADSHPIAVFAAIFDGPVSPDEIGFERALWRQLQAMHRLDAARPDEPEPPPIAVDEADEGFRFGDRTFFVVGLHPAASRWARRFAWPSLVFNALTHDTLLRGRGQYERMQEAIRRRDTRLQGAPNPAADLPQVAQFSGRLVEPGWQCPLETHSS